MSSGTRQGLLPAVFTVGARIGIVNGGGRLTVKQAALIFEPGRVTRRLSGIDRLVHTDASVVVLEALLAPPWFNTSVSLRQGRVSVYVMVPLLSRRRLLEALSAAGFHPGKVSTRFRVRSRN